MFGLLLQVIPLGIGAALTPSLLGLQILTTSRSPWRARALAVVLGCALAFGVAIGALTLGFAQLPTRHPGRDLTTGLVWLVAGVALAAIAVWLFRPHPGLQKRVEESMTRRMGDARTWTFFTLAFALSIKDVSSFVLLVPATHDIAVSAEPLVVRTVFLVLLFALALSPVLVPPGLRLVLGARADRPMNWIFRAIMDHQLQIAGGVSAAFATYLVWFALGPNGLALFGG